MTAATQGKEITVIGQICKAIDHMGNDLEERLKGSGVSPSRFMLTAKTAVQTHQDKKGLENADRQSLYLAIQKAGTDGLLPDGREGALVVYNTNIGTKEKPEWKKLVQWQPMVQGLKKLAMQSGEVLDIDGYVVFEKDTFSFKVGVDTMPNHTVEDTKVTNGWFGDRGKPIGVWAFVKLKNGEVKITMLSKDRIDRIATRSKLAKNYSYAEGKDWEEFWKKAAIRNVLKYAPRSTALERALQEDNEEFDFENESVEHNVAPVNPVNDKPKTQTRAAAAIKGKVAEKKAEEKPPAEPAADADEGNDDTPHDEQTGEIIDAEYSDVGEEEEVPV